jgi:uncharacterized protein (DUF1697 family)
MSKYVALLRGINVSGQKIILMELLRKAFEKKGFKEVRTYLQSGNVIFDSPKPVLARAIEKLVLDDFGFEVTVVVRSPAELGKVIRANPFIKKKGVDLSRLYVTFFAEAPAKSALKALAAFDAGRDEWHADGNEIFLHCPGGYGETKLSNNLFEKKLALKATTRNWKTVNQLWEMSQG